jgi:hypothetical protein
MADVLLIILILLPAVLAFLLKSDAALAFLALCGGFAATTLSGSDIQHLVGHTKVTSLTSNNVELTLLAVPLLFTLLFSFKTVSGKSRRYFMLKPALCAGGLMAIVAGPMFSDVLNSSVTDSQFWAKLKDAQSFVVGIGLLASLVLVWSGSLAHSRSHGKKHK